MELGKKYEAFTSTASKTAEAAGKTILVAFVVFLIYLVVKGDDERLTQIKSSLNALGITAIHAGVVDFNSSPGEAAKALDQLGILKAYAEDLGKRVEKSDDKAALQKITELIAFQQNQQTTALDKSVARLNERNASAPGAVLGISEGWIYVGRRSENDWRPLARPIARLGYPIKVGQTITVTTDALLYQTVDCQVIAASDFHPNSNPVAPIMVKPSVNPVEVIAEPVQCKSIGGAQTVWVKVKIPADRLYQAGV